MSHKTYNILFLCTGNSARSILAEAVVNEMSKGQFRAYSAGSHPNGQVHDLTLELLTRKGFATQHLRSKNWQEFARSDAPPLDFVITVCDKAAGEACPIWPGQPMSAHWGIEDPAAASGDDLTRRKAFEKAFIEIARRIDLLLALPLEKLSRVTLERQVREIGQC